MTIIYTPVHPTQPLLTRQDILEVFKESLKAYKKYNIGTLLNPYHHKWYFDRSFRDITGFDGVVVCDSGGFQLHSDPKSIDKRKVNPLNTLAYAHLNKPDVQILFDVPMYMREKDNDILTRAKKTLKYSSVLVERNKNNQLPLYNVLHGNGLEEMEAWFSVVRELDDGCVGYAVSPENINKNFNVVLGLFYLYTKGVRKFHVLGTSRAETYTYLKYIDNLLNDKELVITYDTANELHFAKYRVFVKGNEKKIITRRTEFKTVSADLAVTEGDPGCDCPGCRYYKDFNILVDMATTDITYLLWCHNVFNIINTRESINIDNEMIEFIELACSDYKVAYRAFYSKWYEKAVNINRKYEGLEDIV